MPHVSLLLLFGALYLLIPPGLVDDSRILGYKKNAASIICVKWLSLDHHLSCICILEPFLDFSRWSHIVFHLRFAHFSCNDNNKIWLFWKPFIYFYCFKHWVGTSCSNCHPNDISLHCSFIYAKCSHIEHWVLWNDLFSLSSSVPGACGG